MYSWQSVHLCYNHTRQAINKNLIVSFRSTFRGQQSVTYMLGPCMKLYLILDQSHLDHRIIQKTYMAIIAALLCVRFDVVIIDIKTTKSSHDLDLHIWENWPRYNGTALYLYIFSGSYLHRLRPFWFRIYGDWLRHDVPTKRFVSNDRWVDIICMYKQLQQSSTPGQNGRHFADDIFRYIFVNEKFCNLIKILLKFVHKGLLTVFGHWFR